MEGVGGQRGSRRSDQYGEIRQLRFGPRVQTLNGGISGGTYEGHSIRPTSKGSFRVLLVLVVKGNRAIRAVSDTKWCRYG